MRYQQWRHYRGQGVVASNKYPVDTIVTNEIPAKKYLTTDTIVTYEIPLEPIKYPTHS